VTKNGPAGENTTQKHHDSFVIQIRVIVTWYYFSFQLDEPRHSLNSHGAVSSQDPQNICIQSRI
jgi:hypothetical protein